MNFRIHKNYYGDTPIFKSTSLTIPKNSVYVLCGCNGYGKSTLLEQIRNKLYKDYDDLEQVLTNRLYQLFHKDDGTIKKGGFICFDKDTRISLNENDFFISYANTLSLSNGEGLISKFGGVLGLLKKWITDNNGKSLFLLLDDLDSGTSIDSLHEIKSVIELVINDCIENKVDYYVIIPANSYELTYFDHIKVTCIDSVDFRELVFNDYQDYKKYVLETSAEKDKRFSK